MMTLRSCPLMIAALPLALAACSEKTPEEPRATTAQEAPAVDHSDPIASAMAAAPAALASAATIVTMSEDGTMTTLREGTGGYTCMPDSPATPGPDPMCMDANAMEWAMAWIGHKPPPEETPGFMYMLAGGTDASNTDPYATQPAEGDDWIKTGAHVMIVGSQKALKGYPSGPNPDTTLPYVMWAGTPYAHLMIPVD
ncbi:MAG: hypothetical protein APF82_05125 [Sphingomonadales bacterium BRH_c42]|nr:MAG: hypothetical protein APF82_05125 [Sphingomonadales bacterium BRH_c42]